jgi:hypothetical protein
MWFQDPQRRLINIQIVEYWDKSTWNPAALGRGICGDEGWFAWKANCESHCEARPVADRGQGHHQT